MYGKTYKEWVGMNPTRLWDPTHVMETHNSRVGINPTSNEWVGMNPTQLWDSTQAMETHKRRAEINPTSFGYMKGGAT